MSSPFLNPSLHSGSNAPNPLSHLSVLIVDDNFYMLKIVRTILRSFGIEKVLEAKAAEEAFTILRQTHIDIIIVDYLMDMLDGIEFTRLVRTSRDSPNPMVPIIMLTAYSERRRVMEARDAGVTEFCCKPVTAREIFAKLRAVVMKPRPFVRTKNFFGPDRRRFVDNDYDGEDRRQNTESSDADPFS